MAGINRPFAGLKGMMSLAEKEKRIATLGLLSESSMKLTPGSQLMKISQSGSVGADILNGMDGYVSSSIPPRGSFVGPPSPPPNRWREQMFLNASRNVAKSESARATSGFSGLVQSEKRLNELRTSSYTGAGPYANFGARPYSGAQGSILNGPFTAGPTVSGLLDNIPNAKTTTINATSRRGLFFNENHESAFKQGLAQFANGAMSGFNRGGTYGSMFAAAAGGLAGGIASAGASFVFPENVQYDGMVKPIIKGVATGAALGALHGGAGRVLTKAFPQSQGTKEFFGVTKSLMNSSLYKGALALSAGASTVTFTRAYNPNKGV